AGTRPLRGCWRSWRRLDDARQDVLRGRQRLRGNHELLDRIRFVLCLLRRLDLRCFLNWDSDFVFARKLRLTRRLFHPITTATAAAARSRLAQPDDGTRRLKNRLLVGRTCATTVPHHQHHEDENSNMPRERGDEGRTDALGRLLEQKRNFVRVCGIETY